MEKSNISVYDRFLAERKELLNRVPKEERELIEAKIKLQILEIWKKRKGDFFYYEDYYEIKELVANFPIITVNADRNIGKTTSAHRITRDEVGKGNRFMWLRNNNTELIQTVNSDADPEKGFITMCGWSVSGQKEAPNIANSNKNIVGYYRDINSGKFKSIEFPNTSVIVWDEFNSNVVVRNKFETFATLITTVQRHRPDLKVIVQANFIGQGDEWLQLQGYGLEKREAKDFAFFNWITGTIIISVPSGIYKSVGEKMENLGYRLSLESFETYSKQWGGTFTGEVPVNVINTNNIVSYTPVFNIFFQKDPSLPYGSFKLTLYNAYNEENKFYQILTSTREVNDAPVFIYDYGDKVKYPNAILQSIDTLSPLIESWQLGNLKTDSLKSHEIITKMFALALKRLDSEDELKSIESM